MSFLARIKGPLGQRPPKPTNGNTEARRHMARVKALPCLVCGCHGVEVHHEGKPRNDLQVLPLCPQHHRREYGPGAYHYLPRAFYEAHGDSKFLLAVVADQLAGEWNSPWRRA